MYDEDIVGELTPPEDKRRIENVDNSILEAIEERGISYPAEIVGDTGISRQTVFDHLRHLCHDGKIERVMLRKHVPDDLKKRLQELWDIGMKGGMIKHMSWYRLSVTHKEKK